MLSCHGFYKHLFVSFKCGAHSQIVWPYDGFASASFAFLCVHLLALVISSVYGFIHGGEGRGRGLAGLGLFLPSDGGRFQSLGELRWWAKASWLYGFFFGVTDWSETEKPG